MFPSILKPLLRAAAANGIAAVRNPFETPGVISMREAFGNRTLFVRKTETTLLRLALRGRWLRAAQRAGVATTDGSLGVAATGALDAARLRSMLRQMPPGTWELVCHPGYNDRELAKVRTKLRESREVEMAALQSITREELREEFGAELMSFRWKSPQPAASANI
jgi:predicted glycoside hydrolase/deacetylase ChbG (UPF0249 family)